MSCSQTSTNRTAIASNAGAMAAGYGLQSPHAPAAHDICRRPLLHPATREDGRRAAIRHYLNMHGQLLPASSAQASRPSLAEQARQACAAVVGEGMRQAGMLAGQLSRLALAIDAGLRFPAATAEGPSCAPGPDGMLKCAFGNAPDSRAAPGGGRQGGPAPFTADVPDKEAAAFEALLRVLRPGETPRYVKDEGPDALLISAVHAGDAAAVDRLSRANAGDWNNMNAQARAFMQAVSLGRDDLVRIIMRNTRAHPCPPSLLMTALSMAIHGNNISMVSTLLEYGAYSVQDEKERAEALEMAVRLGHDSIARLLRQHDVRQPLRTPAPAPD